MPDQASITSESLQEVFARHVLPLLSLPELAQLACTCMTLQHTVYHQQQAWRASAVAQLPATGMYGAAEEQVGIISDALQGVLAWEMLPLLSLHDLAQLACTSTVMRDTSYKQNQAWRNSACAQYPELGLQLQQLDRAGVQLNMQRRLTAVNNIKSCQTTGLVRVKLGADQHGVSLLDFVDGTLLAGLTRNNLSVYAAESGKLVWKQPCRSLHRRALKKFKEPMILAWLPDSSQLKAWLSGMDAKGSMHSQLLHINAQSGAAFLGADAYDERLGLQLGGSEQSQGGSCAVCFSPDTS